MTSISQLFEAERALRSVRALRKPRPPGKSGMVSLSMTVTPAIWDAMRDAGLAYGLGQLRMLGVEEPPREAGDIL